MTGSALLDQRAAEVGSSQTARSGPRRAVAHVVPAAAVLLSLLSLRDVDVSDLGPWGLVAELPWSWYAGLGVLLVGLSAHAHARVVRPGPLVAHLAGLVVVLYGTAPLVEPTPRYYWAFKHIGVARYILDNGEVDPSIDIYHRWPGFFAVVAALSRGTGLDALDLARGAELFFGLLNALLVVVLVRAMGGGLRVGVLTSALFCLCNWVGQGYFAPQALAVLLSLGIGALVVSRLSAPPRLVGRAVEDVLRRIVRAGGRPASTWTRPPALAATIAVVLLLHAGAVVTHQLTPYVLVLSLLVGGALGHVRPLWVVVALGTLNGLYLLPQLGYLLASQSLFGGFDPVANAAVTYSHAPVLPEKLARDQATTVLTLLPWLLAMAGILRRARRDPRQAVLVGVLAFSPVLMLLVQSYGGEARLRVILFTVPWLCVAAAWLLAPVVRWRAAMATATSAVLLLLAGLFVVSFLGNEDLNSVSPAEVQASEWLYSREEDDYVVLLGAPGFPLRVAGDYDRAAGPTGDSTPSIAEQVGLRPAVTAPDRIAQQVADYLSSQARDGYVVFSTNQLRYARTYDLGLPVPLPQVEAAVQGSALFRPVFENPDARVYQLVTPLGPELPS